MVQKKYYILASLQYNFSYNNYLGVQILDGHFLFVEKIEAFFRLYVPRASKARDTNVKFQKKLYKRFRRAGESMRL